jgi:hypothetical protein
MPWPFTVAASDGTRTGSLAITVGVNWMPTEAKFLTTSQNNNAYMVSLVGSPPPPITVGGHLTVANALFVDSATNGSAKWISWVDAMYAAGIRRVNIEPALDWIYNQYYLAPPGSNLSYYSQAIQHARSLGMSISINPEYETNIGNDCTTILGGNPINSGAGTNPTPPPYAPGVGDWYTCLTSPVSALGNLSIYQWIVANWLQSGDTFAVLHEPTLMASRWGEGVGGGGCNDNYMTTGNTCPNDWVYNFLNGSTNNIISHVQDCAMGTSLPTPTCPIAPISITTGVTTWLTENQQTPNYADTFATGLPAAVPMGLDMYFFDSTTAMPTWLAAIAAAKGSGHPTFVEEFAPQRWVQHGESDIEQDTIKGAMSCDWQPPFSYNLDNFFAAFLSWISSTGASSASWEDPVVLSACVTSPPSRAESSTVLSNATTNFVSASPAFSEAFYRLGALIAGWSGSAASQGPPLGSPTPAMTISGLEIY